MAVIKIKLGNIVNNMELLETYRSLKVGGDVSIDIRENVKKFYDKAQLFEEIKVEVAKKLEISPSVDGTVTVDRNDPRFAEVSKHLNEAASKDIELDIVQYGIDIVRKSIISADEIDGLVFLGLLVDPKALKKVESEEVSEEQKDSSEEA